MLFYVANYPCQSVKGTHSVAGDVTSASTNLEKQTSHDSTQLLAFSCGLLKALFQSSESRDGGVRGSYWHMQKLLEIEIFEAFGKKMNAPDLWSGVLLPAFD